MQRVALVLLVLVLGDAVGYGLTVISPGTRRVVRRAFVTAWVRLPFNPSRYRVPDAFAEEGTHTFVAVNGQIVTAREDGSIVKIR